MERKKVNDFEFIDETNKLLRHGGLFLVSKSGEKTNAMTIGWGFLGTMWSKTVFVVAVRHSRYTYELMEASDSFTVCLPSKKMEEALEVCGTKSGRDMNKISELGFTMVQSENVDTPYINESPVHFECKVIYKDSVKPGELLKEIEEQVYGSGDYHVLYYGLVEGTYAVEEAEKKLP
jgi:flavin reductase (DIM6/NTAB) family NADH-FMN oxidoreductase RutF